MSLYTRRRSSLGRSKRRNVRGRNGSSEGEKSVCRSKLVRYAGGVRAFVDGKRRGTVLVFV
jgi:hypothetical protein